MNREIKFRVWDTELKEMIEAGKVRISGTGIIDLDNGKDWTEDVDAERFIVMQYTGLKDKNGKEIYEGDILQLKQAKKSIFVVEYEEQSFIAYCKNKVNNNEDALHYVSDALQIVGNIYEHPHLLREGKF